MGFEEGKGEMPTWTMPHDAAMPQRNGSRR
jgi:hypothetical protein